MTKAELVDKLASEGGITKVQANKVLGALVEAVIAAMTSGEAVMLGGLGTFKVSKRNERKGRNPQTGKDIVVPASMVPNVPGSELQIRHIVIKPFLFRLSLTANPCGAEKSCAALVCRQHIKANSYKENVSK